MSLRTGEMMKHALNAFLGVSICFANELGNICDAVGADGKRVGEMLRLEPRVGPKAMLLPGLGFSGGTLARDMQTLRRARTLLQSWHAAARRRLESQCRAKPSGRAQARDASSRSFARPACAVFGLTYKPDTSTLRRSAAIEVIGDLVARGVKVSCPRPACRPR